MALLDFAWSAGLFLIHKLPTAPRGSRANYIAIFKCKMELFFHSSFIFLSTFFNETFLDFISLSNCFIYLFIILLFFQS